MKKLIFFLLTFCMLTGLMAQQTPQGMQYQAVARDADGQILADQNISLQISLMAIQEKGNVFYYTEVHQIQTSKLGLFNLVVGEGGDSQGEMQKIPWSEEQIYMELALDEKGGEDFEVINTSRLLTVPYAFHAGTADDLTYLNGGDRGNGNGPGVPANVWHLKGNSNSDPAVDKLGTTDCADLVIVTDNQERMRILCSGAILIDADLDIGNDLTVQNNVEVNISGGNTIVHGDLDVVDGSTTTLSGDLIVDGTTNLNSSLDVNNISPTNLTGILNVDGATTINNNFTVTAGNSLLNGDLTVNGPTLLNNSLQVIGITNLHNDFNVLDNKPSYLSGSLTVDGPTILNNSLQVLGITNLHNDFNVLDNKPSYLSGSLMVDGPTVLNNTLQVLGITNLHNDFNVLDNKPSHLTGSLTIDGVTNIGSAFSVINNAPTLLTGPTQIQNTLNVANNATFASSVNVGNNFAVNNCLQSGSADRVFFKFNPNIVHSVEGTFGNYPLQISGSGHGQGVAIKLNAWAPNHDFLAFFAPNTNGVVEMRGRIEGKTNFLFSTLNSASSSLLDYDPNGAAGSSGGPDTTIDVTGDAAAAGSTPIPLNAVTVNEADAEEIIQLIILSVDFIGSVISAVSSFTSIPFDPVDIFEGALGAIISAADLAVFIGFGIANIGVAYQSGSGDYAEYLMKNDLDEKFNYGEVVGVIGGKISKEFLNADKYMVVSAAPAVLGAMPQPELESNYEKIAFVGQIPVKVRGEVHVGDYILPSGEGDGLAIAVNPDAMQTKDYLRIIGIAWEDWNEDDRKKIFQMINTAVGINQNDLARMVEQMQIVMNQMQLAIEEVNPTYEGFVFETSTDRLDMGMDYTVSPTHTSNMEGYFDGIKYENREELGMIVAEAIEVKTGIDLSEYPVVQKILLDPEYAEAAQAHYSDLLDQYLDYMDELKSR